MVAVQLAKEPVVKQAVRQAFVEKARIAVKPTKKGQKVKRERERECSFFLLKIKSPFRKLMNIMI